LPYLAWFEGGVFELFLIAFAGLNADAWGAVRSELVATALIRVVVVRDFGKSPPLSESSPRS
jgi:hypothetical protein